MQPVWVKAYQALDKALDLWCRLKPFIRGCNHLKMHLMGRLKEDISTAKNYMFEKEIKELERVVVMYLGYAE